MVRLKVGICLLVLAVGVLSTSGCTGSGSGNYPAPPVTSSSLKTYSGEGFSFLYPEGYEVIPDPDPTVHGLVVKDNNETYTLGFVTPQVDAATMEKNFLNLYTSKGFTYSYIDSFNHTGHEVHGVWLFYGGKTRGYASWWRCSDSNREYILQLETIYGADYAKESVSLFIERFQCH